MVITRFFFIMALAMALAVSLALPTTDDHEENDHPIPSKFFNLYRAKHHPRPTLACNKFPRICHATGSPGRDCCRRRCANLKTDNLNCGRCGQRCRFGWACCSGRCINVMYDAKNSSSCKHRCKKGSFCRYGMCSYA